MKPIVSLGVFETRNLVRAHCNSSATDQRYQWLSNISPSESPESAGVA